MNKTIKNRLSNNMYLNIIWIPSRYQKEDTCTNVVGRGVFIKL